MLRQPLRLAAGGSFRLEGVPLFQCSTQMEQVEHFGTDGTVEQKWNTLEQVEQMEQKWNRVKQVKQMEHLKQVKHFGVREADTEESG